MRKTSAVLATLSLAAIALTGCSASAPTFAGASASCDRTSHANGVENAVTVTGDLGAEPDVTVYGPVKNETTSYVDLITGDGAAVVTGQQVLQVSMSIYNGTTGAFIQTAGGLSTIEGWASQSPGLGEVLECVTDGSRVVASLTAEDLGDAASGLRLNADDRAVFVIDVTDVYLSKAQGALQFNDARGVPTVVRAPDGTPGVIIPDTDAPTSQVVQTLIEGDGEPIDQAQTPIVNLTAVGWDDKTVISTTWGTTPSADLASTAPAVAEAIIGKPVGSQLLVVTPGADGAAAVVYVVDILGAVTISGQ